MADFCPVNYGDLASVLVADGHAKFMTFAQQGYALAVGNMLALGDFVPTGTEFTVSFDFTGQLAPFQRPIPPVINDSDFVIALPDDPGAAPAFSPQTPDITAAPVYDVTAPMLSFGTQPDVPIIQVPVPPPNAAPIVVPAAPVAVLPPVPTLLGLNLPVAPSIQIDPFTAIAPSFTADVPPENWSFTPEEYVSDLLTRLKSQVTTMLDGSPALPLAIEQALFARGRSRIELEVDADIEQMYSDFASRGFSSPPGTLAARIDMRRQTAQIAIADYARETSIKQYEESLANMRLALQQGIAIEGLSINLFLESQKVLLEAARFMRETAIAVLNARIAIFNAQIEAYKTNAEVFVEKIKAQLALVQLYSAQIDAERLKSAINQQSVEIYTAQMKALEVMADFYRAQIDGVRAQADVERAVIESYKARVDAYSTQWEAYGKQVDAYRALVDTQGTKASIFSTEVGAFRTRIDAWSTENGLSFEREKLRLAEHQSQLSAFLGSLQKFNALLDVQRARVSASGVKVDAQARIYTAEGSVEASATAATDRSFELGLRQAETVANLQVEGAKIRSSETISLQQLMVEIKRGLAQVSAQLAASSMSAVNYGAQVSSSQQKSASCGTNFSFQGDISDAGI